MLHKLRQLEWGSLQKHLKLCSVPSCSLPGDDSRHEGEAGLEFEAAQHLHGD